MSIINNQRTMDVSLLSLIMDKDKDVEQFWIKWIEYNEIHQKFRKLQGGKRLQYMYLNPRAFTNLSPTSFHRIAIAFLYNSSLALYILECYCAFSIDISSCSVYKLRKNEYYVLVVDYSIFFPERIRFIN